MIPHRPNIPLGLCQCGCGEKTPIANQTRKSIGWVEGLPIRFIMGHANRQPRVDFSEAVPFKIDGVYCKLLSLTRGLFAIVDAADYEWLKKLFWYATWAKGVGFYAVRKAPTKKKLTGKMVYLHRFIIGLPIGEPQQGDHKNGVTLDCRRKNLRPATQQQNNYNQRINCRNTSGHKHVSWSKEKKKWVVRMRVDGKMKHIGYRDTFEDACKLAEEAEKKYHGEFARAK